MLDEIVLRLFHIELNNIKMIAMVRTDSSQAGFEPGLLAWHASALPTELPGFKYLTDFQALVAHWVFQSSDSES